MRTLKKPIALGLLFGVICLVAINTSASGYSKYSSIQDSLNDITSEKNVNSLEYYYSANDMADPKTFVSLDKIKGAVTDQAVTDAGGVYRLQKLMTYKEYIDLGIDDGVSWYIDAKRMVWVLTTEFNRTHNVDGILYDHCIVTTTWDAATGDPISMIVQSDDPDFTDKISEVRPPIGP
jgi:hypothetical protein